MSTLKTIGDLNVRNFTETSSNKTNCNRSALITIDDFKQSKPCGVTNNHVSYNGHQILSGILNRISENCPGANIDAGQFFVYRDHIRFDGYCEKRTPESGDMPLLRADTPISDLVFERVIGKINIQSDHPDFKQTVAFKYEPKYLEIAIGLDVKICSNYNILSGRHYITSSDMKYPDLMQFFESDLKNYKESFEMDLNMIEKMKKKEIQQKDINFLLGDMLQYYHIKESILQLTDVTALSQRIIDSEERTENMWDFVNRGTEVLRFDNCNGDAILENIKDFNTYTFNYSLK